MSVPIDSATAHCLGCLCTFLVASFRVRALATHMGLLVPAQPTVVPGLETRSRNSRVVSGKLSSEMCVAQECLNQLGLDTGKFFGQGAVGGSER